jgi:hypothetical protein
LCAPPSVSRVVLGHRAKCRDRAMAPRKYVCNFSHRPKLMQIGTQRRCADGPQADLKLRMLDARFSPVSGHYQLDQSCPESAHKQTSPSRIHRYPSCLECVASPRTAEDPAPVIFRERLERRGPGLLCGPVLFRQPGRHCMLNHGHRVSPRAVTRACRSPRFALAASMPSASVALP